MVCHLARTTLRDFAIVVNTNRNRKVLTVDGLLSPQQLADYLGVPVRTVYAWNHQATGPTPLRVGRHVRYRREDVEAWLEAHADRQEVATDDAA